MENQKNQTRLFKNTESESTYIVEVDKDELKPFYSTYGSYVKHNNTLSYVKHDGKDVPRLYPEYDFATDEIKEYFFSTFKEGTDYIEVVGSYICLTEAAQSFAAEVVQYCCSLDDELTDDPEMYQFEDGKFTLIDVEGCEDAWGVTKFDGSMFVTTFYIQENNYCVWEEVTDEFEGWDDKKEIHTEKLTHGHDTYYKMTDGRFILKKVSYFQGSSPTYQLLDEEEFYPLVVSNPDALIEHVPDFEQKITLHFSNHPEIRDDEKVIWKENFIHFVVNGKEIKLTESQEKSLFGENSWQVLMELRGELWQ